jgi:DNA-binding CsgD family transcriptional regulator
MSPPRNELERAPDGITPLVGYRWWTLSVGPGSRALHSLNGQIVHEVSLDDPLGQRAEPWLVARCLKNEHDAPEESCSCGFYAVKSLSTLWHFLPFTTIGSLLRVRAKLGAATWPVAGRVDLAGKVIEHDLGYRAERMRITELRAFAATEQTVTRFARRLGVPVGESIPDPSIFPGGSLSGSLAMGRSAERDLLERLTPREVEVLCLLASGTSGTEIAAHLAISPVAVRGLVQNILPKLQVHSRLEAVAARLTDVCWNVLSDAAPSHRPPIWQRLRRKERPR